MPEELQVLLEKIQKEGIDKADAEARKIVAEATEKAAAIRRDAEAQARETLARATREGEQLLERGRKSLEQAARDVVLSIGSSLNRMFLDIASRQVGQALSADVLKDVMVRVVDAYCRQPSAASGVEILLSPEDRKKLSDFFLGRFKEELNRGLSLRAHDALSAGFRVSLAGGKVQHDFSAEAIADAMAQVLRPQLAEIVRKAVQSLSGKPS